MPADAVGHLSIWRHPAVWWRCGIALAGLLGLSFETSSLVYFTVQSNVIVLGYFVGALYWTFVRNTLVTPAPRARGAVTFWILITGLVSHLLLNHGQSPLPGLIHGEDLFDEWAVFALHYVVPTMVFLDWLLFSPRRVIAWAHLPLWLAYPLAYALAAVGRAAVYPGFVTPYPYFFLDPRQKGYGWVFGQFVVLAAEFAVLGALLILVDRLAARLADRRADRALRHRGEVGSPQPGAS
jgi:hypothetical protein